MSDHTELLLLQQDVRIISDHQRILGGLIDTLLEDDDLKQQQIRRLQSEKEALLAANAELRAAIKEMV